MSLARRMRSAAKKKPQTDFEIAEQRAARTVMLVLHEMTEDEAHEAMVKAIDRELAVIVSEREARAKL